MKDLKHLIYFEKLLEEANNPLVRQAKEGKPMDEIAAGVEMSIAKRCFVMAKKAGATDSITLTGGCAKNAGLKQAIEHVLKFKVLIFIIHGILGVINTERTDSKNLDVIKIFVLYL